MAGCCKVINISRVLSILCEQDEEMFLSSWSLLLFTVWQQWESWAMQALRACLASPANTPKPTGCLGIGIHTRLALELCHPASIQPPQSPVSAPLMEPPILQQSLQGKLQFGILGSKRAPMAPPVALSSHPQTPNHHLSTTVPALSSCLCADPSTEEIFSFLFFMLMRITCRTRNMIVTPGLAQTGRQTPPQLGTAAPRGTACSPVPPKGLYCYK